MRHRATYTLDPRVYERLQEIRREVRRRTGEDVSTAELVRWGAEWVAALSVDEVVRMMASTTVTR